eukprot:6203252-Pleurochrysis_carterae.AAC.2
MELNRSAQIRESLYHIKEIVFSVDCYSAAKTLQSRSGTRPPVRLDTALFCSARIFRCTLTRARRGRVSHAPQSKPNVLQPSRSYANSFPPPTRKSLRTKQTNAPTAIYCWAIDRWHQLLVCPSFSCDQSPYSVSLPALLRT